MSGLMFPKTTRPRALVRRDRQRQEEATYRANSAKARERDGHCCRVCGRHWGLETHHVKPRSLNRRSPSKHDLDRLLTLCAGPKSCHEAVNQKLMRLTSLTDRGTNGKVMVERWCDAHEDYVVAMKAA
jgi:5-methylcytosine-specific restriction endonuclease McrA